MKRLLKLSLFYIIGGFTVLFLLRLLYGYFAYPDVSLSSQSQTQSMSWGNDSIRSNYASKTLKLGGPGRDAPATVDQKYEKIGTLSSKTSDFDHDEQKLQAIIDENDVLIQFEQRSGLAGKRVLNMALGVLPEKFDQVLAQMKTIGVLLSIQIDKSDKTNEYKELEAKKKSLEKAQKALFELTGHGGSIRELIELENRILDIENQIQSLGVSLGEFDEENEFCTVKFTLLETTPPAKIPLFKRLKVAFEWTIKYYSVFILTLFIGTFSVFLVLSIIQKVRWLQRQIGSIIRESKAILSDGE